MSRTARIAAAATVLSALLCAGSTVSASAAVANVAAGPASINWDTAPVTGNSINWD
ncbi:hypothetical protein ACFXA3_32415 [Streptomyces sp. NPDC059456]|uniref:hypothetical protein n=1 Tax=Streptomyces sp. NPDC059456 TaxID=3346838 RepID=UPI00369A3E6A